MLAELERLLTEQAVGGARARAAGTGGLPLLEPMLRALHRAPERLEEIDRLLADMRTAGASTDRLLPPELEELWADDHRRPGVAPVSIDVDTDQVLAGLKDFQRATVEHVFNRLFDAPDSTRRFLVADEVGLGKTMVARGVVAKAIERLNRDGVERIDIIYICSNGDIAAQNVRKLDVTGTGAARASRLTLLAKQVRDLRDQSLNLVALTPGTSFEQSGGAGRADERVLLYWLLREAWSLGNRAAPKNIFQGWIKSADDFRDRLQGFDPDEDRCRHHRRVRARHSISGSPRKPLAVIRRSGNASTRYVTSSVEREPGSRPIRRDGATADRRAPRPARSGLR